MSAGAELLARIAADPDDPGNYLVYADWLASTGTKDPLAELIVHSLHLADAIRDGDELRRATLGAWHDAYISKHRAFLYGALADRDDLQWEFRFGFLHSVRVLPARRYVDLGATVAAIFALPAARFLRELHVFIEGGLRDDHGDAVAAAFATAPPTLAAITYVDKHTALTDAVAERESVRWLALRAHEFPDAVLDMPNLEILELQFSELARIPDRIGELSRLRYLDVIGCSKLADLPTSLFGIETLAAVDFGGSRIRELHNGRVNNLLAAFARARTPSRRRMIEMDLLRGRYRSATIEDLLAALDSNVATVRENAVARLGKQLPDPRATPIASVAWLGRTSFDKARIATLLGVEIATKVTDATTHVIVGESPGGKQLELGTRAIIVEPHLKAWTLEAASTALVDVDAIRAALRRFEDVDVCSALAGLDGTLPPALYSEVLVIAMDPHQPKARAAAKKLLAASAPERVLTAMKLHFKQSLLLPAMASTTCTARIRAFCKATEPLVEIAELERAVAARRNHPLR